MGLFRDIGEACNVDNLPLAKPVGPESPEGVRNLCRDLHLLDEPSGRQAIVAQGTSACVTATRSHCPELE